MEIVPYDSCLRVVQSRSIHDIPEALWDSVNAGVDLYHTHRFIRSVEDAHCSEARFWYLLFYQGDRLAGTAALSSFVVHLDLFLGTGGRHVIDVLRRFFPSLLFLRVLFCGLPVSIGKDSFAVATGFDRRMILRRLAEEMTHIARGEKVGLLCVKEFLEEERSAMNELLGHGFFQAPSLPYARLRLRWNSFDEYLSEMRHGYRRQVLQSLRKLGNYSSREKDQTSNPSAAGSARLVVGGPETLSAAAFHGLYLEVMRRAEFKLEILPLEFFERLYENLGPELVLFAVAQGGKVLGAAICAVEKERMTFLLVGLDYNALHRYNVYFNLIHAITKNAIEQGCSMLDLGQTSYWIKSRIGAETTPQWFYLRSRNIVVHWALKVLRPLLFPGTSLPHLSVMKHTPYPGGVSRRPEKGEYVAANR